MWFWLIGNTSEPISAGVFESHPGLGALLQHCGHWGAMLARVALYSCRLTSTGLCRTQLRRSGSSLQGYSQVSGKDIDTFRRILGGDGKIITSTEDAAAVQPYSQDWTRKWGSRDCPAVLLPKTTNQVAAILKHCNDRQIAVVPQGGNTGLVGGSIPLRNEVVLSLTRMKGILSFDPVSGVLVCEAGCILEELDTYLRQRGYMMPLDLGAKGSCVIGGNVSTNAGGLRYLRYGSLHGSVLGLEVVLPDGRVLDLLNTLRKDNVGYDLKQLFIGAEGTLGVVTKVAIQVPAAPKSVNVAILGVESFDKVRQVVVSAKANLGEIISALEFMDAQALAYVLQAGHRHPLENRYPFYMLIETSGSDEGHDADKMGRFLEGAMEQGLVADGALAQDGTQAREMWKLRELIPVTMEERGRVLKYDVSLPMPVFYDIVQDLRERLKDAANATVVGYGHLGDSNLHLNIGLPRGDPDPVGFSDAYVMDYVMRQRGSISAEHGLGQLKNKYLGQAKPKEVVEVMRQMKALFDPKGILNPYKFFPPEKQG